MAEYKAESKKSKSWTKIDYPIDNDNSTIISPKPILFSTDVSWKDIEATIKTEWNEERTIGRLHEKGLTSRFIIEKLEELCTRQADIIRRLEALEQ